MEGKYLTSDISTSWPLRVETCSASVIVIPAAPATIIIIIIGEK